MSLTTYDPSVPTLLRGFDVLSRHVEKASAFAHENGIEPSALLGARLAPDMLSSTGQIRRASDEAKNGVARLAAVEAPPFADTETSFAELAARIAKTTLFLRSVDRKRFDGSDTRVIELRHRGLAVGEVDYLGWVAS